MKTSKKKKKKKFKLWLFGFAKFYGSLFEKMALNILERFCVILHIFLSQELAKPKEFLHGHKLDTGVRHAGVL